MSSFDERLEKELAKLEEEKKKKKQIANIIGLAPVAEPQNRSLLLGKYSYLPSITASVRNTANDTDDIAPVRTVGTVSKKDEEDGKLDFFQKGAFEDGYQIGDVTKTILGTVGDAGLNALKGITGLGEGIGDLVAYGYAGVADAFGADEFAERTRKGAQVNLVDKATKGAEDFLNQYSVLDRTSDAILQGVGQVGGIIATGGAGAAAGLGTAGTTALTTGLMGASGMGSGMGEAYQGGATDEEAALYGAISGAADALSELMFGGLGKAINATGFSVGLSSADDMLAKKVSSMFSSQIAKNIASFGIKAGAEGLEEVVAGTAQAIGKKLTYMSEEDLGKILKDENLLEQFVVGAVTSGIAQAPGLHIANKTGSDFITGQTQNEQAVIKKEIENRIAEAEKDGKKLTAKEKANIEAQVEKDMERGYISTDTIEEVLGGETYQRYKKTVDSENALIEQQKALQEEFDTLNKMKQGEMTGEQIDRRTDLKEELAKLKETIESTENHSARDLLKQQLSESVSEMVRSDRLIESYNERSRRGQAFEADLTKYDTKQQAVVQKAIDSGVLNNTNRSHELVDLIAKVASDKDLDFDFTNNEKIKGTQFAVEGKIVNGYVTDSGITLNVESPKYLESTVGHEITHVLEGTELYSALQQTIFDYAKSKGEYDSRLADLTELYKDVKGTNIEAELTADLVGDYLFQDSEFINRLSTENRNVFRKIYDEIKYLCRVVTAGSKEARELEKVKKAFEDAYRANGKAEGGTKFSLTDKTKPTYEELVAKNPVQIVNVKGGIESGSYTDMKTATMKKATSEGWFDVPHHNTDTDSLIFITEKSFSHAYSNLRSDFGEDTIRCMAHIPEIIQNAVLVSVDDPRDPTKQETKVYTFFGAIEGVGGIEPVKLTVKEYDFSTLDAVPKNIRSYFEKNGVMKSYDSLYDAHALEVIGIEGIKKESDASGKVYEQGSEAQATSDSIINIADLLNLVKGDATKYIPKKQYSLSDAKPTADKDIRYSISGINARTANSSMLLRAEHMLNAGADSETVRQETGWYKGYDGKMRFEIDDSKSELIDNPDLEKHDKDGTTYFTGKLADILNHEDLYEAYPQLRNVNIIIQETEPGTRGIYQPNSNYLTLSLELFKRHTKEYEAYLNGDRKAEIERIEQTPEYREYNKWYEDEELSEKLSPEKWLEEEAKARDKFFNSDLGKRYYQLKWGKVNIQKSEFGWGKEAKEVLMHEIQHAIQKIEDFARGSNPGYWRRVLASGDTIQTAEQKAELREAENKLYEIYKQNPEFYTEMTELLSTAPDMPRGKVDWDTLEQIEEDPIEWQEFDKKRDALEEKYGSLEVFDFFDLHHDVERYRKRSLDADDAYYSTAGEIEARDTANRLNLTAEERRNKRPDIDKKRVVFTDRYSLSDFGEQPRRYGDRATLGKDVELAPLHDEIGPVAENATTVSKTESVAPVVISKNETTTNVTPEEMQAMFPDDLAPNELDVLVQEKENLENRMMEMGNTEDFTDFETVNARYTQVLDRIAELEGAEAERVGSLTDADIPPEKEAVRGYKAVTAEDPFAERSETAAGDRSVKAYQYENPEVKPFFREAAYALAEDINLSIPAERWYNDDLYYASGGEKGFGGYSRLTAKDVGDFKDQWKCSWDDLREAVNDIIEDHGKENNALSKRVEFLINDRLMYGYTNIRGERIEPNQAYLDFLKEKQINEYSQEAREAFFSKAEEYAPFDIAPVPQAPFANAPAAKEVAPVKEAYEAIRPKPEKQPKLARATPQEQASASVLVDEPKVEKKKPGAWNLFKDNFVDKGTIFETLSLKTGNRELQGRWKSIGRAESSAQWFMEHGNASTSSLKSIRDKVEKSGKTKQFYEYLYHLHNVDRMSLQSKARKQARQLLNDNPLLSKLSKTDKFADIIAKVDADISQVTLEELFSKELLDEKSGLFDSEDYRESTASDLYNKFKELVELSKVVDKPVFGYGVTAKMSGAEAAKLEKANPEFKAWSKEVYDYMTYLRKMMVDSGVISNETAKLWAEMYPHYVPVRRKGDEGLNINVALDTRRTGVNAPVKKATGGNRDILPLFDTMAMRTEQTFKAVARNRFGVTLKNMLGTTIENEAVDIDEAIDSVETELLQEGKDGKNPTFTVFENGEKVTFEITDEMYDTMKPKSKAMGYTNKVLNTANNIRRGLLTEYNPAFMLTNPIKDTQDVLMNSQHPAKTYANYPKAIAELIGKKGLYYREYMEHGGEQNTYFDSEAKTFVKEKSGLSKVIGFPLEKISQANNFIERIPRMAEYIASRKEGRSIDVSMLDAARVTTDFSAGGDLVKALNRNGFTFLNASVQGAVQQVRNVREAKAEGLKGWAKLAAKVAAAGLPAMLLNHLLWDDDEEYAELSDYVKQNYYIVAKFGDGKFVRIPKGRTLAVIQDAFEQMENLMTGNDEVDLEAFGELVISNLAPSNPLENNLIAPITQALNNTTWYGDDLVPTRLQDLPAAEQFDETTDSISKWLGEKLNLSPYKINYVLDQYSGAVGDLFLPMLTPEAERGTYPLIAPISDKFTTDSVMKNQNISDFYDKKGELTTNAKASGATAEDVLMNKYMNSINSELSELYAEKRKIQNTNMSDAEKYKAVRDIQKQIVDLTRESLATYDEIDYQSARDGEYAIIGNRYFKLDDEGEWRKLSDEQVTKYKVTSAAGDSSYASDGTNHYRWYEPGEDASEGAEAGWRKVTDKELERQKEVTGGLGISPEEYWGNRKENAYAYDNPESYAVAKAVGGYEAYKQYSSDLYDIKADKDENGKSISGSRKEKVIEYINGLDVDYGAKLILFKAEYPATDDYNYEIVEYLNSRDDISYEDTVTILTELGFTVASDGTVTWD